MKAKILRIAVGYMLLNKGCGLAAKIGSEKFYFPHQEKQSFEVLKSFI